VLLALHLPGPGISYFFVYLHCSLASFAMIPAALVSSIAFLLLHDYRIST
jgi:hypothetical protein